MLRMRHEQKLPTVSAGTSFVVAARPARLAVGEPPRAFPQLVYINAGQLFVDSKGLVVLHMYSPLPQPL